MVQSLIKRPTSPLSYEPLYTPPEDVLYPGSDEEATPEEREKRRVRIEIQGQQYLNGGPLFILSAGLRGPFDKGWVNPWKSKKRKYGVDDIRRFPQSETRTFTKHPHVEASPSTAGKSTTVSDYGSLDYGQNQGAPSATEAFGQEQLTTKRRRHRKLDEPHATHGSQRTDQGVAVTDRTGHHWLKTDKVYPQKGLIDDTRSSTPTPTAKAGSKSHAISSTHSDDLGRAMNLTTGLDYQKRTSRSKDPASITENIKGSTASMAGKGEGARAKTVELTTTDLRPGAVDISNDVPLNFKEINLSKVDDITRYGYDEVKRLSQRAAERQAELDDGQQQARRLSQAAAARAIESNQRKTHTRLTPYVSEFTLETDAASSAGLRAAKAPKPKPSPHAVPPSTYQPEFKYHYARKGMSASASPQRASFVDAPEQPQRRPRSDSSSSSGSSAFAEALEAAQEKAASKSFISSKSSSPATEMPETKSVKKNRQALRRLTFTPSGGAKIASARTSSRPSSSSSAVEPGKTHMKRQKDKPLSNDPPSLPRTSTRSSARSLTNVTRSGNSIILPDAQSDPIARPPLAQLPSGPSTNLLETDKQLSKVPSLNEDDSYFDLSTQAAVCKAQRSFQADVLSALTPLKTKKEESSPIGFESRKPESTSTVHGRRDAELANAQLIKSSDSDDEEPMSTQAMVDAISPFVVTTIKKRSPAIKQRTSSVDPSPTKNRSAESPYSFPSSPMTIPFPTHSPGMSTSPSPTPTPSPEKSPPPPPAPNPIPLSRHTTTTTTTNSKLPSSSSVTSFSILPNGTLTETSLYQQDGQQRQDDLLPDFDISLPPLDDPFGGFADAATTGGGEQGGQGKGWDLNRAIEEAGSFLGDWDVEAEARREGRGREEGGRGILKGSA